MKFVYEKSSTREDALREICEHWNPQPPCETVPLDRAFGRMTACELRACATLPVVRSSKMDGIAVRSSDFTNGVPDTGAWRRGVDFAQADTGDDFPDAFDAVVAIEHVRYDEGGVPRLFEGEEPPAIKPGLGVNPAGSIVRAGCPIAPAHMRLTPELVAACAVGGLAQVEVLREPVVGFLATGSELIPWGSMPERGQNIVANSLLVRGLVAHWFGVAPETHRTVRARLGETLVKPAAFERVAHVRLEFADAGVAAADVGVDASATAGAGVAAADAPAAATSVDDLPDGSMPLCFPLSRDMGTVESIVASMGQIVVPQGVERLEMGVIVEVQLL